ncbi:hypothetical protein RirG_146590 [Rhizophagus irregularis DAOM 197198w]|uniref:Uncharacterized protein n=1 Tax=Rhizophagus irregularis (strain DAOM 197198w) TaxID=1432141 RepID=A0A015MB40_RHIIW|nr:hypothetical protein RirG_146590 [Rhizophagus irregularis DAOM 197198w]
MPLSPVVREEAPGEATAQPDSSSSNSESGGTGIASVDQTKVEVPPLRAVTPSSQRLSHELQKISETEVKSTYSDLTFSDEESSSSIPLTNFFSETSSQKSPSMPNQEDENTKTIPPIIINEDGDIMTDKEVMRDTYLRIRQELCDLSSQKDWIIEGYNVSDAFRKYQITNIDKLVDGEIFQFSSDIEAILSLHFIDLTKTKKSLYLDIEDRKWRASRSNQFRPEINDIDEFRSKFYDMWEKYRDKVIYSDSERRLFEATQAVARTFYERMHMYPHLRNKNEDTVVHDYIHDTFKEIFRDPKYEIVWANAESLTSREHRAIYGRSQGRKPDITIYWLFEETQKPAEAPQSGVKRVRSTGNLAGKAPLFTKVE